MTRLTDRFIADRALRDTARRVLNNDIERLRGALAEQGIASRVSSGVTATISDRIRSGARDVLAEARVQAGTRKGLLAGIIAAIVLFLARGPILDWIEELLESDFDEEDDPTMPDGPAEPFEGDPA
ncbi:hypothetical protein [Porphyrobacter sp. AAP82]|uniref:hypothetical protein n=1 Tax=Porphyrobacter sp. AAP82 TaxID=1248917 RepID=UPI000300A85C|nr:hypothetical protein [Porphyrobacter sp. AAP82]